MSFIQDIEAKIAELAAQIKTHSGYVTDIETTISKLATDKITSTNNLHILNGATQAYTDVLNLLKSAEASPFGQAVEAAIPVVEAIAPLIGELV